MDKDELKKLQVYMRKTFGNASLEIKPQPKKKDMAEVFIGQDQIAQLYRDEEDGEVSYQLQMAILDIDLEDA